MPREIQVTFDASDPAALAAFWAEAVGYELQPPPEPFESWDQALDAWGVPESERNSRSAIVDPTGAGPRFFFQQVPEGKAAKNRVHLDIRSAPGLEGDARMEALEAACKKLIGHGAARVRRVESDGPMETGFIVMQDPEGNEFCLD